LKIVQGAKEWGVTIAEGAVGLDMNQVQARKNRLVAGLSRGVEYLFRKNTIEWIKGTARLAGRGRIEVTADGQVQEVTAREILIATGSAPRGVPGVDIDRTRIITSDEAVGLREVPKSLIVLGSGPVGVEFASLYRRFGSQVTIIELLPRLVPAEDEAISPELDKSFRKQGIAVYTGTTVTKASSLAGGVDVDAQLPDGRIEKLHADYLLVAVGRRPVTEGLGAEEAGVRIEHGFVCVDDLYRTDVPGISAVGDVVTIGSSAHPQLAHVSSAEGILAVERIAGKDVQPLNYDHVPACTYCDPEIGSVGLTERQAQERGYDVRTGTFPFGVLGRAKIAGEVQGFVKIVADKRYDEVLGVHMIGPRSTELVAEATLAVRLECTVEELCRTIHAHPTFSEAVGEAARATHGTAIQL
jgi:dihydrolipoamide dehydrogenase